MDELVNKRIKDELKAVFSNLHCNMNNYYDELFDKLYFLYVILKRYSTEVEELLSTEELDRITSYYDLMIKRSIDMLKAETENMQCKTLFEQSQITFNYLGLSYLEFLEKGLKVELSHEQIKIIKASRGYSYIFDYMVMFWAKEMDLGIKISAPRPKNKVEQSYLHTHFFLTKTRYFNDETSEDNIADLLENVDYVIDENLGDLVAELYWALSYFQHRDIALMNRLRGFLISKFINNSKYTYSHYGERENKHAKYSLLCAFMEERKKARMISV